ncbi:Major Facilitator Superfamily protein [Apiospora arundinis]|uniref:Major Facilitator Superfamily protein n=1 Tax=Apiospora arundinis TaxID=335852 RepID=A0ABR2I392_9PEZI
MAEKTNDTTGMVAEKPTGSSEPSLDNNDAGGGGGWVMDTSDFPGPKALIFIMIALFLAMFTNNLDATIIATAIPAITDEFHTIQDVAWYVSSTFLTFASFQSTWGKAYKYFPIKTTFMVSLFIFELGSLICALAPTSTAFIVGRAIAGAGAAGVSSGVFIIIAFSAPPQHVPAYMGVAGATYAIAALVGPLLGGVLTRDVTWRWCFWINLPIGAVTAVLIVFVYRTPKAASPQPATWREKLLQMDLGGTFLIMAAVVCFILAFQWGGVSLPWNDSKVIGTLVGFALISLLFVANEWWMGDRALLEPRLMRIRRIWSNCAHVFFISGGFFVLIYYLPIYFQSVQGVDPLQSGVRNLPVIIGCFFSILAGFLVAANGRLWGPLMAVGALVATVGGGLLYTFNISTPTREWIGYQALTGIGTGITMQIPMMANQAAVSPMDISAVSAITLFFQIIGGSLCVSGAQAAFASVMVKSAAQYVPGIDTEQLISVGATQLRSVYPPEQIDGIVHAYMDGLKTVFAFGIALLGLSFVFTLVPKWDELRPGAASAKNESSGDNGSQGV